MGGLGRRIWLVYYYTGMMLGVVMEASYLWLATWGGPHDLGFWDRVRIAGWVSGVGTLWVLGRILLWLPSLVYWFAWPGRTEEVTFWKWLVPGLFGGVLFP